MLNRAAEGACRTLMRPRQEVGVGEQGDGPVNSVPKPGLVAIPQSDGGPGSGRAFQRFQECPDLSGLRVAGLELQEPP